MAKKPANNEEERKRITNRQISVLALSAVLTFPSLGTSAFAQEKNPDRNAYLGEEHIHTSWSVDAWLFGNRITGTR